MDWGGHVGGVARPAHQDTGILGLHPHMRTGPQLRCSPCDLLISMADVWVFGVMRGCTGDSQLLGRSMPTTTNAMNGFVRVVEACPPWAYSAEVQRPWRS